MVILLMSWWNNQDKAIIEEMISGVIPIFILWFHVIYNLRDHVHFKLEIQTEKVNCSLMLNTYLYTYYIDNDCVIVLECSMTL